MKTAILDIRPANAPGLDRRQRGTRARAPACRLLAWILEPDIGPEPQR